MSEQNVERPSPVSGVLDYSRSFVTFFTRPEQGGNIARIQIDAACRVDGWGSDGGPEEFFLIAPCRSERMYLENAPLFQMPNYEFCGIFTRDQVSIVRTFWTSDTEYDDIHVSNVRFERVPIDLVHANFEQLDSDAAVVAATLANRRLVARTHLRDERTGTTATLEYPIKTMNVRTNPESFQVDTGPLIIPLFEAADDRPIARFAIAHVVYWQLDRAEFVLRRPHEVGERDGQPVLVTDYSEIQFWSATNEIWGEVV